MKRQLFLFGVLLTLYVKADELNDGLGVIKGEGKNEYVFEGDVMETLEQRLRELGVTSDGNAEDDAEVEDYYKSSTKWPDTIPYAFEDTLPDKGKEAVASAIGNYNKYTCIRFVERTTERNYLSFYKGTGCWSYIGRIGGRQRISLGDGCHYKKTAVHEIMHALGFKHEQSRPDRDDYVVINWDNIKAGKSGNFAKHAASAIESHGTTYDFRSVMHYSKKAFSTNGKSTIDPIKHKGMVGRYTNEGLSTLDAKQINDEYCDSVYPNIRSRRSRRGRRGRRIIGIPIGKK